MHPTEERTATLTTSARFSVDVTRLTDEIFGKDAQTALEALTQPVRTYFVRCNTNKISPEELTARLQKYSANIKQHPVIPEALGIEVEGPFDILSAGKSVIVDKMTAESTLQGANVYAPGILDCGSVRIGDHVTVLSELEEPVASGQALMSANEILTFRKGLAIRVTSRRFKAPQIREMSEYADGYLYPQSLPAIITSRVLNPQPGDTVLDMNCAPGGKLSHLSELLQNSGHILGFDRNSDKVAMSRRTLKKLGCKNVTVSIHDSRYLPDDLPSLKVDRVLIDPPCSALGLRPKVYDFTTQQRVSNLANYQRQFVKAASRLVKPGGSIVYSVCTFTAQECEQIMEFAQRECNLRVVEQRPFLGSKGLTALGNAGALCQRFHPHVDEIGYFIAKFER
jgi:predicted RNA-binding protein (TIGR00451 family)